MTAMDPRNVPAYGIAEAAHYLHLPQSTLGHWIRGHRTFKPVIATPGKGNILSFINLVEAHVLWAITRKHRVRLQNVRPAIQYLTKAFKEPHPLAMIPLETDRVDVLVRTMGDVINATKKGQVAMREVVEASLRRVDRDIDGSPVVLYPFVADDPTIDRKPVMFNPTIAFGRLVLVHTGVPTIEIARRYKAGESMEDLAGDYGRSRSEIEDAVRCELQLAPAA
jgi:uncharacterized protein (DUF433 family)